MLRTNARAKTAMDGVNLHDLSFFFVIQRSLYRLYATRHPAHLLHHGCKLSCVFTAMRYRTKKERGGEATCVLRGLLACMKGVLHLCGVVALSLSPLVSRTGAAPSQRSFLVHVIILHHRAAERGYARQRLTKRATLRVFLFFLSIFSAMTAQPVNFLGLSVWFPSPSPSLDCKSAPLSLHFSHLLICLCYPLFCFLRLASHLPLSTSLWLPCYLVIDRVLLGLFP